MRQEDFQEQYELIYGRRPVIEVLRGFRTVFEIYGTDAGLDWFRNDCDVSKTQIGVPIKKLDKEGIFKLLGRTDHQGLAAKVSKFQFTSNKQIVSLKPRLLLLADGITDPHNLGAMIRSAYLCNAGAVLIPQKNSADITPVVVHCSAGATEHIAIVQAESITHTVQMLKENGYYIIAAEKPEKSTLELSDFVSTEFVALIMGSEGEGVHKNILRRCDDIVSISQSGVIDSFNVSVATGIILHEFATKMRLL